MKKIKINGKLVLCRPLEKHEITRSTDVYLDGTPAYPNHGKVQDLYFFQLHRPIKPVPKRKRVKKIVKAYVHKDLFDARWFDKGTYAWKTYRAKFNKDYIPVLITLIKKAGKK